MTIRVKHISNNNFRLLIFDSGVGGISILSSLLQTMNHGEVFYGIDNEGYPYGDKGCDYLSTRIKKVLAAFIEHCQPDLVILACNSASTIMLDKLRIIYPEIVFVGVVPPIKPAAQASTTGVIALLATPLTIKTSYINKLIKEYANKSKIIFHSPMELVHFSEAKIAQQIAPLLSIEHAMQPLFKHKDFSQLDSIALGCTHFPLLLDELQQLFPKQIKWFNPTTGVVQQTLQLVNTYYPFHPSSSPTHKVVFTESIFTTKVNIKLNPIPYLQGLGCQSFRQGLNK